MKLFLFLFVIFLLGCSHPTDYKSVTTEAIYSKQVSKCNWIENDEKQTLCYIAYAQGTKDISICNKLDGRDVEVCQTRYNMLLK